MADENVERIDDQAELMAEVIADMAEVIADWTAENPVCTLDLTVLMALVVSDPMLFQNDCQAESTDEMNDVIAFVTVEIPEETAEETADE